VMLMLAPVVSKSVPFYYGSAMAFGIILVILIILFQECISGIGTMSAK